LMTFTKTRSLSVNRSGGRGKVPFATLDQLSSKKRLTQ